MLTALAILLLVVFAYVVFLVITTVVLKRQTIKMLRISIEQFRQAAGILLIKRFEASGEPRADAMAANTLNYLVAAEKEGDEFLQQNLDYIRNAAGEALKSERLREAIGVEMAAETMYAAAVMGKAWTGRGAEILERSIELGVDIPGPEDLGGSSNNREHVFAMLRLSSEFFDYASETLHGR
jgi:hypothetical protein